MLATLGPHFWSSPQSQRTLVPRARVHPPCRHTIRAYFEFWFWSHVLGEPAAFGGGDLGTVLYSCDHNSSLKRADIPCQLDKQEPVCEDRCDEPHVDAGSTKRRFSEASINYSSSAPC
eukprot:4762700-Amphidinium_carterae.1